MMEVFTGQGNGLLGIPVSQCSGDRRVFVDPAEQQTRRLEGRNHKRRTSQQLAQKTRQLSIIQRVDEHQVKLPRETHRRCPISSLDSRTFLLEVALDRVENGTAESSRQFGDNAEAIMM